MYGYVRSCSVNLYIIYSMFFVNCGGVYLFESVISFSPQGPSYRVLCPLL